MKSVLHEASSILKAIEKAWEASGKPSEFSVKILEEGERKFFFFSNKPAIVSIAFEQKHVAKNVHNSDRNRSSNRQRTGSTQERLLNGGASQLDNVNRNKQDRSHQQGKDQGRSQHRTVRPQQEKQIAKQEQQNQKSSAPQAPKHNNPNPAHEQTTVWSQELASFVVKELNEILHIMQITIPFQEKIDQKTLTITFATPPMDSKEDARLFYISLSYLLIQAAKKQEKKKLRGFHLIVNANS